ncbi:hypothetical protein D3C79_814350 [compost metagenome]
MGDDEQGHAAAGEIPDHLQHLLHHLGIQGGGDLVEQHHLGVHAQGPYYGDALLLAAGELARIGVALLPQAHPGQQLFGLQQGLGPFPLLHLNGPEQHVLQHGQVREQVIALEHHADALAHALPVGAGIQPLAVEADLAALNGLEPVEGAQQGALAAAARSQDDDHLTGLYLEADPVQYPVLAKLFADSIEFKQRRHTALPHFCSSRREASESG